MSSFRKWLALGAAGLVGAGPLAGALWLGAHRPAHAYRPGPADGRPPADARYENTLRAGLRTRDYPAAEHTFLSLAAEKRQTSEGTWALYQAGLAAKANHDAPASKAILGRLRREYPE